MLSKTSLSRPASVRTFNVAMRKVTDSGSGLGRACRGRPAIGSKTATLLARLIGCKQIRACQCCSLLPTKLPPGRLGSPFCPSFSEEPGIIRFSLHRAGSLMLHDRVQLLERRGSNCRKATSMHHPGGDVEPWPAESTTRTTHLQIGFQVVPAMRLTHVVSSTLQRISVHLFRCCWAALVLLEVSIPCFNLFLSKQWSLVCGRGTEELPCRAR